ncbi:hypothetical protein PI126_g19309 [Phytophthora idaei]|nr:hypothetical protein PI126_g19309 [Phytophthora idaei]
MATLLAIVRRSLAQVPTSVLVTAWHDTQCTTQTSRAISGRHPQRL